MKAFSTEKEPHIWDNIDTKSIMRRYFELKKAGKDDEALEVIKEIPVPAKWSEAKKNFYGECSFTRMGFKIL